MPENYLDVFPKPCSAERPIPPEIWPDLNGVIKAEVVTWEPTLANWKEFIKTAVNFPIVSVDTETSGLRPFHGSRIVGVAMAFFDGEKIQAGYWNFRHQGHPKHYWCFKHGYEDGDRSKPVAPAKRAKSSKDCVQCKRDVASGGCPGYKEKAPFIPIASLLLLNALFQKTKIGGQNFKYDCKMFSVDGVEVPLEVIDSLLVAHLWDELKRSYSLDNLAKEMGEQKLGDTVKEYAEEHGIDIKATGHAEIPYEVEAPYAVRDTVLVLRRLQWERQRWAAARDHRLMDVFQIENACTTSFARMEINGLKLDMEYVASGIKQLETELAQIQADLWRIAKKEFDVMSTQQLWDVLESRGLAPLGHTPGGAPALGATELEAYANDQGDEVAKLVLAYRSRHKILNTYLMPFRDTHADPEGFIHSDFFIHGTVSGRSSSREPNLQNMSRPEAFTATNTMRGATARMIQQGVEQFQDHREEKVQVRRCFIPRGPDYSLFFFDYSQMELRIFADYAEEQFLLEALGGAGDKAVDIHELVAREIFPNFPDKEKNKTLYDFFRQLTKQINFGIIYGMGRNKLAAQLSVPVDETVRSLKMALQVIAENPELAARACTLTEEEIMTRLEDHKVMTATRQWHGLRELAKDTRNRINVDMLGEYLFKDGKNLGLLYSAETFLNKYHARFPKIKKFTKGLETVVDRRGYIFNRYGRRYHLRKEESYIGVNRLVQGTTADQVKVADKRVDEILMEMQSKLINNIHDELKIDMHHRELFLVPKIKEAMEFYPNIGVKMLVEVKYAHTNWAEKRDWKGEAEFMASLAEIRGGSVKPSLRFADPKPAAEKVVKKSKKPAAKKAKAVRA